MKLTQRDFAAQAGKAAQTCSTFFFCGPDEAGASAAALHIISLLNDAGERVELAGSDIAKDPPRLADEARSSSLFGDKRHILVRASDAEVHRALDLHLGAEGEACPVLIIAGGATDKSRSAKLLDGRKDAMVGMFYVPELRDIAQSIRRMGEAAGLRMSADIAERLARASGLDIRLAGSEIDKLALYLDASAERPATLESEVLEMLSAVTEDDGFMPIVNAVLSGEVKKLPSELKRMQEVGINPVGLLLAIERRAAQLVQLSGRIGPGGNITGTVQAEQKARRVFYKDQRDLITQLQRWRGAKLERLLARLTAAHKALLENSQTAELFLAQELTQIAQFAARK